MFRPPLEAALLLAIVSSSAVSAFSVVKTPRPIQKGSLQSSNNNDVDLWTADCDVSPLQWSSSTLPLPEYADNPSIAERAARAMMSTTNEPKPRPAALQNRCFVNLDTFNNGRCKAQWLHVDPPVLIVDNFLTEQECNDILRITVSPPPAGAGRVIKLESTLSESNKSNHPDTAVRRSTTWYVRYGARQVAPLLRGLMQLMPEIQLEQTEEVQLVQYMGEGQGFGWHEDVLSEKEAIETGGQRIATLLVYLDECQDGRTLFRDLQGKDGKRLGVSPKKGRALLFFPAITASTSSQDGADARDSSNEDVVLASSLTTDEEDDNAFGNVYFDNKRADHRTTHAGEPPMGKNGQKHIAQLWIHSGMHTPVAFGEGLNPHPKLRQSPFPQPIRPPGQFFSDRPP